MGRRILISTLAVASLVSFAPPGGAMDFSGATVVIPVVIHGSGARETEWRTDVFVTNTSGTLRTIVMTYYPDGEAKRSTSFPLGAHSTTSFADIVKQTFGLDSSAGILILTNFAEAPVNAYARIYNVGGEAGEFGQMVPGVGVDKLSSRAFVAGVTGLGDNRSNIGITNPTSEDESVTVSVTTETGVLLATETIDLAPFSVVQINNIFTHFDIAPRDNVVVTARAGVSSEAPIYFYASVVRNDTGDAIFLFGGEPVS